MPLLRKPKEGRTIAVVGDLYRFLATCDDTNGKYAMWEAIVAPGGQVAGARHEFHCPLYHQIRCPQGLPQ